MGRRGGGEGEPREGAIINSGQSVKWRVRWGGRDGPAGGKAEDWRFRFDIIRNYLKHIKSMGNTKCCPYKSFLLQESNAA